MDPEILSRVVKELDDPELPRKIVIFNTFAFLGVFTNLAVLAPALFLPNIPRRKIWYSLIISWTLYSASFILLLGRQTGPIPPFGLCIFQAALTTATPLVCIVGSTCFAIDLTFLMSAAIWHGKEANRAIANFLAYLPWMVFATVFTQVLLSTEDPSMVGRDASQLFCAVDSRQLRLTTAILILASAIVIFPLEIFIAILFRRYSVILLRKNYIHSQAICFSTFIRLVLFTLLSAVGIGVHSYIIARVNNTVTTCSVVLTALPVLTALIFGTKKDILNAWMFWRKPNTPSTIQGYSRFPSVIEDSPKIIENSPKTIVIY